MKMSQGNKSVDVTSSAHEGSFNICRCRRKRRSVITSSPIITGSADAKAKTGIRICTLQDYGF